MKELLQKEGPKSEKTQENFRQTSSICDFRQQNSDELPPVLKNSRKVLHFTEFGFSTAEIYLIFIEHLLDDR